MSALKTLVNPENWELEEQFMDGVSLGTYEAFYIGDAVYLDAAKELAEKDSTITRLEADKARLVEALADATETIRQMAEADRRQIQKLTEWKRRQSDIDALVKRSNEVKK